MPALRKSVFSSVLLVIDSLFKKSIGLVSTLVLARVLLPADFGIVAIATLVMVFFNVLAQTGTNQYIIRSDNPDNELLNTAFSINITLRLFLAFLLFISSFPISYYYNDVRLILLLQVFSILIIIEGFANPALNLLRRRQEYKQIVKLTMIVKFVSAISAVSVALIFESYWALVVGQFLSITLTTIGGYIVYPYMPRWSLKNVRRQLQFSGWLIPQSLLGYCRTQFDTLIISDMFGKEKVGSYHTMKYLAYIPSSELLFPATEPLLAQLSPLKDNTSYFQKRYTIASVLTMAIAFPISIFLFFYSFEIVSILLGKNWVQHHQLFAWFSLIIPAYAMYHNANRTFIIFAQTRTTLYYEVFCATIIVCVLLIGEFESMLALVQIKTVVELVLSGAYFCYAYIKYTNFNYTFIGVLCIVLIACISTGFAFTTSIYVSFEAPLLELIISGICFSVMYLIFWLAFTFFTRRTFFVSEYLFSLVRKTLKKNATNRSQGI